MGGKDGNGTDPEGFDESPDLESEELVRILDGDRERACVVLAIAEMDGQEYALLAPAEQLDEPDSEEEGEFELFIFKYGVNDEGIETYEGIEDEALFGKVRDFFSTLIVTEDEHDHDEEELN